METTNTEVSIQSAITYEPPIQVIDAELVETPDHTERKHHNYGPSKLQYSGACGGFVSTDGTCEAAEQGTRLHEIMDLLLVRYRDTKTPLLELLEAYSKEHTIDDGERGLLLFCLRELNKWLPKTKEILNEIQVQITNPDGTELNHGHLDVLLVFGSTALLIDYKFGWLPVMPAPENLQGKAYALGVLLKFPNITKIGVMFIQPKLDTVSSTVYHNRDINSMYQAIKEVIDKAELIKRTWGSPESIAALNPGDFCSYCARCKEGSCPAKLKQLYAVATTRAELPLPSFNVDAIDTPEKAALARYWIEQFEQAVDGAKAKITEVAKLNGGKIEVALPSGDVIRYAIEERNLDRVLGSALDCANALADIVTKDEVFAVAKLPIGVLEPMVSRAIYEQRNSEAIKIVEEKEKELDAKVQGGTINKTAAKKELAAFKAEHPKLTMVQAKEQFSGLLEANGLLSRPDGKIQQLKRQKNHKKELTDKK